MEKKKNIKYKIQQPRNYSFTYCLGTNRVYVLLVGFGTQFQRNKATCVAMHVLGSSLEKQVFTVPGKLVFSSVQDENGDGASSYDHHKARERDSLKDLRVRRRKSAVLFTVMAVALIASSMRHDSSGADT